MIVRCEKCRKYFDDEFRLTYCPHDTFPANDGHNHFEHHRDSYLDDEAPSKVRMNPAAAWPFPPYSKENPE